MRERGKYDSRESDLRLYLAAGRYLLKTDDLHFGYWTDDLEVDLHNLPQAQEKHSEFILSHIPDGTTTILDVGCGVGRMASRLMALGYKVDGVSPSAFLATEARQLLGESFRIFECRFENLQTENRYDLVLFSESFQYVRTEEALSKCLAVLDDGGHVLICDYLRTNAEGQNPLKKGLRLNRFYEVVTGLPFEPVEDIDITNETAPTMDLFDGAARNVFRPMWDLLQWRLRSRRPLLLRLLEWMFRKKIRRLEQVLAGAHSRENFQKFQSYRLFLYRKQPTPTA